MKITGTFLYIFYKNNHIYEIIIRSFLFLHNNFTNQHMLSKNKLKLIQSLNHKKGREKENCFLAEGDKIVTEALNSNFQIDSLLSTSEFINSHSLLCKKTCKLIEVTKKEIQSASLLQSPQNALVIIRLPEKTFSVSSLNNKFSLALDSVQNPGNLGTIIRIADWFGIRHIICSTDTVDCFSPKVIQASMGAIFRVKIHYLDLESTLKELKKLKISVSGTFLGGENIFTSSLPSTGILIMGNEGKGISEKISSYVDKKLTIPSFGNSGTESLNVAIATAICCSEFKRRTIG